MEIRSILVNVDLDAANSTSLRYAIDLAQTLEAELIGVAAAQPALLYGAGDGGAAAAEYYALEAAEVETQLKRAEQAFRSTVPSGLKNQWQAYVNNPVAAIVEVARAADLIVTAATTMSTSRQMVAVDLGEIVLRSGRPVLNVATYQSKAKLDKIMIAWKDTREARRAVADALPLLKRAGEVTALTVSESDYTAERNSMDDLLAWLARHHGVTAQGDVVSNPDKLADTIESTAIAQSADLVVSGGYGHSRMREWLFGGVTRNLLAANRLNRLLSN